MSVSDQPSVEEQRKLQDVAQAGAQAAATGPPEGASDRANEAMRTERDRVNLKMSDEDIRQIAEKLNPLLLEGQIEGFRQEGVFDAPPDAPRPPANQEPPIAGETPPPAAAEQSPQQPRRTFAHRYMGLGE